MATTSSQQPKPMPGSPTHLGDSNEREEKAWMRSGQEANLREVVAIVELAERLHDQTRAFNVKLKAQFYATVVIGLACGFYSLFSGFTPHWLQLTGLLVVVLSLTTLAQSTNPAGPALSRCLLLAADLIQSPTLSPVRRAELEMRLSVLDYPPNTLGKSHFEEMIRKSSP